MTDRFRYYEMDDFFLIINVANSFCAIMLLYEIRTAFGCAKSFNQGVFKT